MTDGDAALMDRALDSARRALAAGAVPVGACLAGPRGVVDAANDVVAGTDPTAHAEIQAIRAAAGAWRTTDLSGCRLFVTVEPCPMCRAACHYAGIDEVIYGVSLHEMHALTGAELVADAPGPPVTPGDGHDASLALLETWTRRRTAG